MQSSPDGLAQAFIIGKDFIGNDPCALVLGDNIFYGHDLYTQLGQAMVRTEGATVFAYHVHDHERYAVTGLYFYDNQVIDLAANLKSDTTDDYAPEHERRIVWNDPAISIQWPLDGEPVLSTKDQQGKSLAEAEHFA